MHANPSQRSRAPQQGSLIPLVDLHSHSTASDGTLSPAEVVRTAHAAGLAAIALTDHDTVAGLPEAAAAAAEVGIEFVPGCELAVDCGKFSMDILGLWVPLDAPKVNEAMAFLNAERLTRNERIVKRLAELGLEISYVEVAALAGGTVGRPHIAQVLVDKGYANSVQQAFDTFLGSKGKAFVPKTVLTPEAAIKLLKEEGATVLLAHPYLYPMDDRQLEAMVLELKAVGLDGIEAYHSEHPPSRERFYLTLARRHGLLVSGGSDFHGAVKPDVRLGSGTGRLAVPYSVLQTLKNHRSAQGLSVSDHVGQGS